jgi:hypothetical protein
MIGIEKLFVLYFFVFVSVIFVSILYAYITQMLKK